MKYLYCFFILIGCCQAAIAQVKDFVFSGQHIRPGAASAFVVPVVSPGGDSTLLPFTIIHGRKPGPVLGLIAGIHGYEYPPILALQALPALIDPQELSGTVMLLHIANVQAFTGRSVYVNPADGKNLNRSFPGNANGTITECIARFISQDFFGRCNYVVDNHGGDASEDLHPYAGYYQYGRQTAVSREMAEATGFDWLIAAGITLQEGETALYCNRAAALQDIPSITIEHGKLGTASNDDITTINNALISIMRYLHMLQGTPIKANKPLTITARASIKSDHTGIVKTSMKSGELVRKGMKLGYITDFTGKHLQDIIAPADGFIVYMLSTPPVNKGETLFSFGILP